MGRPTRYSKALGDRICAQIAEGNSLRKVCENPKMPDKSTVFRWLRLASMASFRDQYARATTERADAYAEEINELGDEAIKKVEKLPDDSKLGSATVQAYKLKADNLKWNAARMKPKKYGERINVANTEDEPDPFDGLSTEELRKISGK